MSVSTILSFGLAVDGVRGDYRRRVHRMPAVDAKILVDFARFVDNYYILDQLIFSTSPL
jgi:hypothetical protein